jgi:hypothetical protein
MLLASSPMATATSSSAWKRPATAQVNVSDRQDAQQRRINHPAITAAFCAADAIT